MLGDWFFKFDYKSGYHHVDITKNSLVLVGLWLVKRNGLGSWSFPLAQLPPPIPYVFTKIQKALVKHWREQGIRIFTQYNDWAGTGKSLETSREASREVREDIAASGFVAHPEKCCWEPTQVGELLGFVLNLREGITQIPLQQDKRLRDRIDHVQRHKSLVTALQLPGLVGSVVSMGLALSPVSCLWTRATRYVSQYYIL